MNKIMNRFMIDCDTSAHYCDKAQYNELSLRERLRHNIHLFMCKICKEHSAQNTKLTHLLKRAKLIRMPKTDKVVLKTKVQEEIGNN